MENKRNIDHLVEETLDSATSIKVVTTPPFFKDKVLNKIAQTNKEKEDRVPYLNWLTPRYQVVILIALVVVNTVALLAHKTDKSYIENAEDFAKEYGLSETNAYFY